MKDKMSGWLVLWLKYRAQSSTQSPSGTVFSLYFLSDLLIYLGALEMTLGVRFITSLLAMRGLPTNGLCPESLFSNGWKKRQFCSTLCYVIRQLSKIGQVSLEELFLSFIKTQILSRSRRDEPIVKLPKIR